MNRVNRSRPISRAKIGSDACTTTIEQEGVLAQRVDTPRLERGGGGDRVPAPDERSFNKRERHTGEREKSE